ncbi:MAG: hypothetical protein WD772_07675 [Pseudohongiellaceae bacterium]
MAVSKRERNIFIMAGVVGFIFLLSSALPAIGNLYQQRGEAIEDLELQIERERRLTEEAVRWRDRRIEAENIQGELESLIFSGNTVPVIEADIQRALSLHARDSNITVISTRLAERLETEGWLLISQEMDFRTVDAGNTITFLEKLADSSPRLWLTDFSLDRTRNNYTGSVTVVGFARSEGLQVSGSANR